MRRGAIMTATCIAVGLALYFGFKGSPEASQASSPSDRQVSGRITVDGSSTVYPMTDLAAREFRKHQPRVGTRVDLSGSGRGLERLCKGEIDIADASRPIEAKELEEARERGIGVIELPVAFDGITVLTSNDTTWVNDLTTAELKAIWEPGSGIKTWRDVRANWPAQAIICAGPTPENGTFDYFTSAICGKEKAIRDDYFSHHDGHVLAPYVAQHPGSLGFLGYHWYVNYQDRLKPIAVHAPGQAPVLPSPQTVQQGQYQPLSRPLFIYVNGASANRPEVAAFINFYLADVRKFADKTGCIPLPPEVNELVQQRFAARRTGSAFNGIKVGMRIEEVLKSESR
jgi:phosphate transport system substrate-binding protein